LADLLFGSPAPPSAACFRAAGAAVDVTMADLWFLVLGLLGDVPPVAWVSSVVQEQANLANFPPSVCPIRPRRQKWKASDATAPFRRDG